MLHMLSLYGYHQHHLTILPYLELHHQNLASHISYRICLYYDIVAYYNDDTDMFTLLYYFGTHLRRDIQFTYSQ